MFTLNFRVSGSVCGVLHSVQVVLSFFMRCAVRIPEARDRTIGKFEFDCHVYVEFVCSVYPWCFFVFQIGDVVVVVRVSVARSSRAAMCSSRWRSPCYGGCSRRRRELGRTTRSRSSPWSSTRDGIALAVADTRSYTQDPPPTPFRYN